MTQDLSSDRSWLSLEGYIKPLQHEVGPLHKLKERGNPFWFVLQDDERLLYYNQKSNNYPNITPEGSFGISSGKLDVFVILTSNEGKEYLLSPANDACYGDWLTNLKNKINQSQTHFERSSAGQGGFMSRVRNSLRRKKKLDRSMSVDVTAYSSDAVAALLADPSLAFAGQMRLFQLSHKTEEANAISSPETKHRSHDNIINEYRKERSHSYPCQSEDDKIEGITDPTSKVKKFADKACDTSSLVCLDWIITDGREDTVNGMPTSKPVNVREPRKNTKKLLKAVGINYDLERQTDSNQKANSVPVKQRRYSEGFCGQMGNLKRQTDTTKKRMSVPVNQSQYSQGLYGQIDNLKGQTDTAQKGITVPVNQSQYRQGPYGQIDNLEGQTDTAQNEVNVPINQTLHGLIDSMEEEKDSNVPDETHGDQGQTDIQLDVSSLHQGLQEQTDITEREGYIPVNQSNAGQTDSIQRQSTVPVYQSVTGQTEGIQTQSSEPVNQSVTGQTEDIQSPQPVNQSITGQTDSTQWDTSSIDSESTSETRQVEYNTTVLADRTNTWQPVKPNVHDIDMDSTANLSLQQQKLIRDLDTEVCKLKCEVISLIQGTIKVPLKDDDLADWHYVEEIRYKDRIFELLREARLYNPSLPDLDSSKSSNFKDVYGFIHGSRESESVVFHFVCRELTQHYSSFFQNRTGHERFWDEYTKAKKKNDDKVLYKQTEIKRLVQDGIPSSCRAQVWKSFISEKVDSIKTSKGANFYNNQARRTGAKNNKLRSEMSEVERQIRCDLLRTMPNNDRFKTLESEAVTQLSRILHVFADLRPDIGYLQGMNFLVGMFLLFMGEEDSFWSLYAVVDIYLKNYFDRMLSGVQADQEVLKELVAEKLPALHAHLKYYGVDISTVTFNWFITVYLDAVPFETAVRIWDSFLFEGREVLFRIAIGLLKLQQRSLLQLSGHLEIMQYMKRAARVMYDVDRLFKASFEEMTKFPTNEILDEKQKKYRLDYKSTLDHVSPIKHETSRSRVSSFIVELPSQDRMDRLSDQYQMVECAVATSKGETQVHIRQNVGTRPRLHDLSGPVCIPCSVRGDAKVYLLDINKKEMSVLDAHINSRILCADVLEDGTVLIGTVFWCVYAFDIESRMELWSVPLRDSVIDLCHYDHVTDDKVYAALADGCIAVLPNANGSGPPCQGSHVRIGSAPVMCVTMVDDKVWCGCGRNVVVLDASSLEELHATVVSSSPRHQVARLLEGNHGVWCNIRGSSWVMLIDQNSYDFLLKIDVALDTTIIDAVSESQVTVSPFQESRITTVMPFADELWVGLGNGQVLIFDLIENEIPSKEEDRVESSDSSDITEEEQECLAESQSQYREQPETCDKASSEFTFSLKMRVQYRVSEEAIRSLEILRETEDPMVLSCDSTLSPEGGLSIWQKQATHEDLNEWMNYPIRHSQA